MGTGQRRSLLWLRSLSSCLLLVLIWGGTGCAIWWPRDAAPELDAGRRAARIQVLREAIDQDHSRLEVLITESGPEAGFALQANPEIARIAERLDLYQRELSELEATP